jgi:hypothetical protein
LAEAVSSTRSIQRELLRREVLAGSIETLCEKVLGYEVRPFHRELLRFQSAHDVTPIS